jgi:preprotein translocase subunit SecF
MNLMKYRKYFYILSLIIIIPGTISLFVWKLKLSIDFTGGSYVEIQGTKDVKAVSDFAKKDKLENVQITQTSKGLIVRSKEIPESSQKDFKSDISSIKDAKVVQFETVGPSVSKEITRRAFTSVVLASVLIVLYIAYAFRKVPKPANSWEFGITAVFALLHDVLVVIGVFSLLGHFFNIEIDPLFITAILTVIGFSVHDTIVIFDRIRENLIKGSGETFEEVVNRSVVEMLPRDLNNSFLVWSVLLVLFILGGSTIRYFVLALLVGILSGTYSSILNASPLLISWEDYKRKKKK